MSLYIHLLACAFGMGSWVAINGLWVELPLIVNVLPEGWNLPSYLTVIIQMANLGPLLVTVSHKLCPGRLRENLIIYVVLTVGVLACIFLTAFWRYTTVLFGAPRSSAFFVLTFFLALVDCTSSVTFMPFMMQLPAKYITSYFIGEGLSGFLPGLVALAQGVGMSECVNISQTTNVSQPGEETFSVQTQYLPANFSTDGFFSFLVAMMVVSLIAFALLNRVPRTYELSSKQLVPKSESVISVSGGVDNPAMSDPDPKAKIREDDEKDQSSPLMVKPFYSRWELVFIYVMVVWVNGATNGVLPSVQTYSCMPYGNLAYHLAAALALVANPLACIIAMFAPKRSLVFLGILSLLGSVFGGYNMAMAAMSPCPLLQGTTAGEAIIVISWVFFTGLLSYVKVMVGVILRDQSHIALVFYGAAQQLGSLVGSVTMFPLVSVYHLFQSGDFCTTQCPLSL